MAAHFIIDERERHTCLPEESHTLDKNNDNLQRCKRCIDNYCSKHLSSSAVYLVISNGNYRVSNLWTVPCRDFWPRCGQPRAKPENSRGSPDLEAWKHHFQHSQINISVPKCLVNWSSFHAWYLPLVRNAWEVTKRKRPCTNAIQLETLGNGFLFADFCLQLFAVEVYYVALVKLDLTQPCIDKMTEICQMRS